MYYPVGEMIRVIRNRQGITQEELSHGICTTATLSKIENNYQIPKMSVANALLERLGVSEWAATKLVSGKEHEHYMLGCRIQEQLKAGKLEDIQERLREFEQSSEEDNMLARQQFRYLMYLYHEKTGREIGDLLQELIEALACTGVHFPDVFEKKGERYTIIELEMLKSIAVCWMRQNEMERAVELLKQIKKYLKRFSSAKIYTELVLDTGRVLTEALMQQEKYEEALQESEEALYCCLQTARFQSVSALVKYHATASRQIGRGMESQRMEGSLHSFHEILTIF